MIRRGNSVRVRRGDAPARTVSLGRVAIIVECDRDDCEWFSTEAMSRDHAELIAVGHARVAHPERHPHEVWLTHGRLLRYAAEHGGRVLEAGER